MELLDTPGILWPKFEDQQVGLRLAWIGSIKEEILNTTELAAELLQFLCVQYPGALKMRYGIEEEGAAVKLLEEIARVRGCLTKGGQVDVEKAGLLVLDDFRSLRLGQISLSVRQISRKQSDGRTEHGRKCRRKETAGTDGKREKT